MHCGAAVGAGEESGRLAADQALMMRSRGRVAAVAVGGHVHAETGRQRGEGNVNERMRMQMQMAERMEGVQRSGESGRCGWQR